jgi:hypothetical protein
MAQINIPGSGIWSTIATALNNMFTELYGRTGVATYTDGQYTEASPLVLVAGVTTPLPNDKATVVETQLPVDLATLYDGASILATEGDGVVITISFTLKPTVTATDEVEVWIDNTAGTGSPAIYASLLKGTFAFKQLVGAERPILYTVNALASEFWETNGGRIKIKANGAANVYGINYTIARAHKAR